MLHYLTPSSLGRALPVTRSVYPSVSLLQSNAKGGTGISTSCPSPTTFVLGLGPDLPWEDELYPGTLSQTVDGILTHLIATHTGILSSMISTRPFGRTSPFMERSPTIPWDP